MDSLCTCTRWRGVLNNWPKLIRSAWGSGQRLMQRGTFLFMGKYQECIIPGPVKTTHYVVSNARNMLIIIIICHITTHYYTLEGYIFHKNVFQESTSQILYQFKLYRAWTSLQRYPNNSAVQSLNTITTHSQSNQLLPFDFAQIFTTDLMLRGLVLKGCRHKPDCGWWCVVSDITCM